ncbi:hypothetical protein [Streptomyces heilongjiangensis]|uniref:NADH-quinone oxidoreductase subunit J n=1 Tax=Streptomyces heilongjiangensis TaxID=945052 RepID=A0ABW1B7H1_9ACTN|nr:hypothetical protein [Streptomyces heilongjiangensis]MDC2947385.1 hypothetical protein [Streptomyces heilongjiangensis]
MTGKRRMANKNRVIGLLMTVSTIVAAIPLGALAFADHVLWAYGLFELLLGVLIFGVAMLIMGERFEETGGETSGNDGVGLGGSVGPNSWAQPCCDSSPLPDQDLATAVATTEWPTTPDGHTAHAVVRRIAAALAPGRPIPNHP